MVRQVLDAPRERQRARALNSSCEPTLAAVQTGLEADAGLDDSGPSTLGENHHRSGGKKSSTSEPEMQTVKMHQVNCLVDDQVLQMLDRCKELLSGKHPCGMVYNTLMQELATEWLKKHDPAQRVFGAAHMDKIIRRKE
jgi:hypothetical protein